MRCAHCKGRHNTVAKVRLCAKREERAQAQHDEAEAHADFLAMQREERWHEERGGAQDDPRERELWALEDIAFRPAT